MADCDSEIGQDWSGMARRGAWGVIGDTFAAGLPGPLPKATKTRVFGPFYATGELDSAAPTDVEFFQVNGALWDLAGGDQTIRSHLPTADAQVMVLWTGYRLRFADTVTAANLGTIADTVGGARLEYTPNGEPTQFYPLTPSADSIAQRFTDAAPADARVTIGEAASFPFPVLTDARVDSLRLRCAQVAGANIPVVLELHGVAMNRTILNPDTAQPWELTALLTNVTRRWGLTTALAILRRARDIQRRAGK